MAKRENLIGRVFNRLTVDEQIYIGSFRWCKVTCICGTKKEVRELALLKNNIKSCGCLLKECLAVNAKRFIKHNLSGTPEYGAWLSMKGRCRTITNISYKYYGGRGITFCQGWHDPQQFVADMGLKPTPTHSLDRIDNEGNYSCGHCEECVAKGWTANCKWSTKKEQIANRSSFVSKFSPTTILLATLAKNKPFLVTNPWGKIYFGLGLRQFCLRMGLNVESMYRAAKNQITYKGWSCTYLLIKSYFHI